MASQSAPGDRLCRTGDLGHDRDDGTLDLLGRNDFQVKIRGYRIELGEIESELLQCAGVRAAVVLARQEGVDQRLVAHYTVQAGAQVTVEG